MTLLMANAAAQWIKRKQAEPSYGYFYLLEEAAKKYQVTQADVQAQYVKMFGHPLGKEVQP